MGIAAVIAVAPARPPTATISSGSAAIADGYCARLLFIRFKGFKTSVFFPAPVVVSAPWPGPGGPFDDPLPCSLEDVIEAALLSDYTLPVACGC